ncbi:hypothetical protein EV175_006143 [Coemansia sp. RSA 1933]|nr:hypothetical protein EV175_006143 [Coemansia sp. RSA 1933]
MLSNNSTGRKRTPTTLTISADAVMQKPPSPSGSESSKQGMARRQWQRGQQGADAPVGSCSDLLSPSVYSSELGVARVSSDSDTILSDISGATTPSTCVEEQHRKTATDGGTAQTEPNDTPKYRTKGCMPLLTLCLVQLMQASSYIGRFIMDGRVLALVGGILMVAPLVGFVILEKLIADERSFHAPVLMQALIHGMAALFIEVLTNRRFGLFVRTPHPLRVASVLPLVAIYCTAVLLSQAAQRTNSVHGTVQTMQCALPLAVMALLAATAGASQSAVGNRVRRAVARISANAGEPKLAADAGRVAGRWVAWPLGVAVGVAVWAPAHSVILATDSTGVGVPTRGLTLAYTAGSLVLSLGSLVAHALLLVGTSEFMARRPGLSPVAFLRHFAPLCMLALLVLWPLAESPLHVIETLDGRTLGACVGVACLGALALVARTAMLCSQQSDGPFGVAVIIQAKPLVCLAIGWWIYGYAYLSRQSQAFFVALALLIVWVAQRLLFSKSPLGPILSLHHYHKPSSV